ncbi:MAG TPA: alpha/beta hydrolase [Candidatus Krumholzibacteria bacterium]|nr:alpha/beta hydrolase [Candidatus Krumholzibacteria bacterium]
MSTKTIAFVHGNFVSKRCWDPFVQRFEARGYKCVPIAYPLRDDTVESLRGKHPDPALARLTLPEVIDHHVRTIQSLDEKPIIMGHSFGGLLTQLLMQRDVGAAGVAIDSVPPQGVLGTQWSFVRSVFPAINPIKRHQPYLMPFEHFQYTFVNNMPPAAQREAYDRHVVPESRMLASGGLSSAAHVDFARKRAPLLLIAGSADHIMPAALNRTNYKRYKGSAGVTDFKEFPGHSHYSIIAGPGFEEVADYALAWAERAVAKG